MFSRGRLMGLQTATHRSQWLSHMLKKPSLLPLQIRHKSWFSPLSKFNTTKAPVSKFSEKIIIEEDQEELSNEAKYIKDLKHYLKTDDIPKNLQQRIIGEKFSVLINSITGPSLNPELLVVLNSVFLKLYSMNSNTIDDKILNIDDLKVMFVKASTYIGNSTNKNLHLPEFIPILAQYFISNTHNIEPSFLVHILEIGNVINKNDFKSTLKSFIESTEITPDFILALLNFNENKGSLNIGLFEDILEVVNTLDSDLEILDDQFYEKLICYVEDLYVEVPPRVHEYKNLDRNVSRVQSCILLGVDLMVPDNLSIGVILKMIKLVYELESVNKSSKTTNSINELFDYLLYEPIAPKIEMMKKEIYSQDLDDETMIDCIHSISASNPKFKEIETALRDIVIKDDIRFSKALRFQMHFSEILSNEDFMSESEVYDRLISEYMGYFAMDEDHARTYDRIIKFLVEKGIVSARGYFTHSLSEYFIKNFRIELSLYSYKWRLDKAIELGDHVKAVNIFEDSLSDLISWSPEHDPTISKSLNDLIVLLCNIMDDMEAVFSIFTKIRQQMVNTKCNIQAINALATKMLKQEYVGDTIEMLKRELPQIKKDDNTKLPIEKSFGHDYLTLFNILHRFVISYEAEETFETNWVLYGELHKYFHVPFDTHLPTMKFFCKHKRYNASLIIFRQIRKLNELHGNHNHLPPSRDMYLYLFKTFGKYLYEDGVEEVHENMKMDINLNNQDIQLQNAVLNAYSNLQDVSKANDLFLSMSSVPKQIGGINEETIQIMIKTYTYSDMMYVQKFWNNLSQYDIVPNYAIYKQYIIANAYHGLLEEAFHLVDEMKDYELEVTSDTLLALHNFSLETSNQKKVANWAKINYSDAWEKTLNSGLLTASNNYVPDNNLIAEK